MTCARDVLGTSQNLERGVGRGVGEVGGKNGAIRSPAGAIYFSMQTFFIVPLPNFL